MNIKSFFFKNATFIYYLIIFISYTVITDYTSKYYQHNVVGNLNPYLHATMRSNSLS